MSQAQFSERIQEWRTVPNGLEDMLYGAYLRSKDAAPLVSQGAFETAFGRESVRRFEARRLEESR